MKGKHFKIYIKKLSFLKKKKRKILIYPVTSSQVLLLSLFSGNHDKVPGVICTIWDQIPAPHLSDHVSNVISSQFLL